MPFVKQECRQENHAECCVGDICYRHYKDLMDLWLMSRRWTNAHNITRNYFELKDDEQTAKFLAWMVWFNHEVMPYEYEKEKENGGIQ